MASRTNRKMRALVPSCFALCNRAAGQYRQIIRAWLTGRITDEIHFADENVNDADHVALIAAKRLVIFAVGCDAHNDEDVIAALTLFDANRTEHRLDGIAIGRIARGRRERLGIRQTGPVEPIGNSEAAPRRFIIVVATPPEPSPSLGNPGVMLRTDDFALPDIRTTEFHPRGVRKTEDRRLCRDDVD